MAREGRIEFSELAARCNSRALEFAQRYLPGGRKDGRHWRCSNAWGGTGGSFYLNINGRMPGKWRDESEDSHGDVLDLFAIQAGDKQRGTDAAKAWLGISDGTPLPARKEPPPETPWREEASRTWAQRIWDEAKQIEPESPGSLYPDARLGRSLASYPSCMRFHRQALYRKEPKEHRPAILYEVKDISGELRGIQRVFLDKGLDRRLQSEDAKKSLGPARTGAIRFSEPDEDGFLAVTEGPEKGHALALGLGKAAGVWATPGAGMLASLALPAGLTGLLIFADNDAPNEKGQQIGQDRAQQLADRALTLGLSVKVIVPPDQGKDWDDYLREADTVEEFSSWLAELIEAAHTLEAAPAHDNVVAFPTGDPREEPPLPESGGGGGVEVMRQAQQEFVYIMPQGQFYELHTGEFYSKLDLTDAYRHRYLVGKMAADMLTDPDTERVHGLTFFPGQPAIVMEGKRRCVNLWEDPKIEPLPGDATPFLDHLRLLCDNDEIFYEEFLNWMANLVQHPGRKANKAPLILGGAGTGKSTMARVMRCLLGQKAVVEVAPQDLQAGSFNEQLGRAQIVVMDEMRSPEKWQLQEVLKPYLANPFLTIKRKYVDTYEIPNRTNWLFISNHLTAAAITTDDRRYFVGEGHHDQPAPAYFAELYGWLARDGGRILLHFLKERDITEWDAYGPAPITEAKQGVIDAGRSDLDTLLREMMENRTWPFTDELVSVKAIKQAVLEDDPKAKITTSAIQNWLHGIKAQRISARPRVGGRNDRVRLWAFRRQEIWVNANEDAAQLGWQRVLDKKGHASEPDEMPFGEGWTGKT